MKVNSLILLIALTGALFGEYRELKIETADTIELPDSFIIEESESLFCKDDLIPKTNYNIDYNNGILLLDELPTCDSIHVVYSYFDLEIPTVVQHRVPVGSGGQLYRSPSPTKNLGMFPEGSRLVHSGSLLRGIKVGSRRDASVESAFQLEAYGAIAEDVEISATLSDQDLPIQPEGTSEKIAQLDQVYIDVTAPYFGATFGDFTAQFSPQSEFTNYERRLSGVRLGGYSDFITGEVVGAVLEGIWATDEFYGQEGNQGPYSIDAEGKSSIQILAGTETVWLDGEKLRRGASNDYTIDYNLGQITFTNNRPIGAQSRIIVDFQFTDLEYRRSFYGVNGNISPHPKIDFYYSGMTELDDPNNPLNFDLTDEERAVMESAGDIADSAYIWGAELSDSGDYALVDSSTDSAHFEWLGEGEGDWEVVFANVGSGRGEYSYAGGGVYEWVGMGEGSYTPRRILPLPVGQSIMDGALVFTPLDGTTLSTEVAASNLDLNRSSNIGDNDNAGGAIDIKMQSNHGLSIGGKGLGEIGLSGAYRRREVRFATIGRIEDAEYLRDWGLEGASGGEQLAEFGLDYSPIEQINLSGGYGYNEVGGQTSRRLNSTARYTSDRTQTSANYSLTKTENVWNRLWGDYSGNYWILSPSATWRYEDNDKASGFRFVSTAPSLGFNLVEWLTLTPSYEYRRDETYDTTGNARQLSAITNAYRLSGDIGKWNFSIYHREYDDKIGAGDIITDLASADGSFRTTVPNISGRLRYELSRNQSEVLEPYYTYVGEGLGNYEFDEDRGEYIASPGGEYLKEYRSTGDFTPVISSDLRASMSIKAVRKGREGWFYDMIKQLSADGLVQAEGQSEAEAAQSLLLDPRNMNDNLELVSGNFIAEGNLRYGVGARSINFRRRFSKYRNTQFTTGEELRWNNSYSLEGRISMLSMGNFRGKVEWLWTARLYPESSRTGTDLTGKEFSLLWTRAMTSSLQLTADMSYLAQTDDWPEEPVSIRRYAISPIGSYFLRKGTVRASVGYSRVESDETDVGILPYEMAHGDYIGDNGTASVNVDINVARSTLLTLMYSLESHSGRPPEHTAQTSVRLTF